jgi:hypothetical protein
MKHGVAAFNGLTQRGDIEQIGPKRLDRRLAQAPFVARVTRQRANGMPRIQQHPGDRPAENTGRACNEYFHA